MTRLRIEPLESRTTPATFTVTTLADAPAGTPAAVGTLRQAVADANATPGADGINFDFRLAGTVTLTQGELRVTDSVVVNGPSTGAVSVNGNNASRVFNIDDGTAAVINVTISGLALTAGTTAGNGGAVFNAENLTLNGVAVTASTAPAGTGGGVFSAGSSALTINGGSISGNRASGGGGVAAFGPLTLSRTTISGNAAVSGVSASGGAVIAVGGIMASGSTFSGNTVTGLGIGATSGGGLSLRGGGTLTNCTLSGNTVSGPMAGGGGIYAVTELPETLALNFCTITGNVVDTPIGQGGGGVTGVFAVVSVNNTIIAGNTDRTQNHSPDIQGVRFRARYSLIGVVTALAPLAEDVGNITGTDAAPVDPLLGPLQNNDPPSGAGVPTHAPLPGSPAYNAGDPAFVGPPATDQRGLARVSGGRTDIGAVEEQVFSLEGDVVIPPPLNIVPRVRLFAVGAASGGSEVAVYDAAGGVKFRFSAFPGFTGGVSVATGDVNRDGVDDIIVGASAGGGPVVKVFDGTTGAELATFFAFDAGFRGGVTVAAADVDGDGAAEIVVGAGPGGGPVVKVFRFAGLAESASFFAFDAGFRGGVSVAAVPGTVYAAPGAGGGPVVKAFAAGSWAETGSFLALPPEFRGGLDLAAGAGVVAAGAGPGGGPVVAVFTPDGTPIASFPAFDPSFAGGVSVGVADGPAPKLVVAAGPGGGPVARRFTLSGAFDSEFAAADPDVRAGLSVG